MYMPINVCIHSYMHERLQCAVHIRFIGGFRPPCLPSISNLFCQRDRGCLLKPNLPVLVETLAYGGPAHCSRDLRSTEQRVTGRRVTDRHVTCHATSSVEPRAALIGVKRTHCAGRGVIRDGGTLCESATGT